MDGRGQQIEIKTKDDFTTPFSIEGKQNIILLNLEFDNGWLNYTTDSEGADAINIVDSHDIWIHHCEFLQWCAHLATLAASRTPHLVWHHEGHAQRDERDHHTRSAAGPVRFHERTGLAPDHLQKPGDLKAWSISAGERARS